MRNEIEERVMENILKIGNKNFRISKKGKLLVKVTKRNRKCEDRIIFRKLFELLVNKGFKITAFNALFETRQRRFILEAYKPYYKQEDIEFLKKLGFKEEEIEKIKELEKEERR